MRSVVLIASAVFLASASAAALAQGLRPAITVGPGDIQQRYLVERGRPLKDDPLARGTFQSDFLVDIAYNLKLWHFPPERGGAGRTVECNGLQHVVKEIRVEGLHVYEGGARGIVYYGADFFPIQEAGAMGCTGGSLMLPLQRLSDGEWFAPDWGYRLVKR